MAVVVKSAFFVVILALKTQRVADVGDVEGEYVAVGTVVGGPDDVAAAAGQFLGRAEVVELVVIDLCVLAFAVQQSQRFEGAGLVEVAAVVSEAADALLLCAFGDQAVALPDKLRGFAVDLFGDASARRRRSGSAVG